MKVNLTAIAVFITAFFLLSLGIIAWSVEQPTLNELVLTKANLELQFQNLQLQKQQIQAKESDLGKQYADLREQFKKWFPKEAEKYWPEKAKEVRKP